MYDEDYVANAKRSLSDKQICARTRDGGVLVVSRYLGCQKHEEALVPSELEAWTFQQQIKGLVLCHTATCIGDLDMFLDLTLVEVGSRLYYGTVSVVLTQGYGGVYTIDFQSLATKKKLSTLRLRLVDPPNQAINHTNHPSTSIDKPSIDKPCINKPSDAAWCWQLD
jgi:hypothetical protein